MNTENPRGQVLGRPAGQPPADRRSPRRLWIPALLSSLALLTVVGGVAVGNFYWNDLRSSMLQMDQTMAHARERQQQMMEHFSQAQRLLLAQQRHLRETEEALRAREARLAAERAAVEDARERIALVARSRQAVEEQTQVRELARRLDLSLADIGDPDGLDSLQESLSAVADWSTQSQLALNSSLTPALHSALADVRVAMNAARAQTPIKLAGRLEQLGAAATRLTPGQPVQRGNRAASSLARDAGAGHLGEQIQTAVFALRRGDETLFRLALDTASAWLAAFYDPGRAEVIAVQTEIVAVRRLPITQDLSALRDSTSRLRAVLGELAEQAGASPVKTTEATTNGASVPAD